jgi:threonine dehydratase
MTELSVEMIKAAARRLGGDVHRTPVMTSSLLDQLTQKCIYFKCEHLQATGSFKARGALNAVRPISDRGLWWVACSGATTVGRRRRRERCDHAK